MGSCGWRRRGRGAPRVTGTGTWGSAARQGGTAAGLPTRTQPANLSVWTALFLFSYSFIHLLPSSYARKLGHSLTPKSQNEASAPANTDPSSSGSMLRKVLGRRLSCPRGVNDPRERPGRGPRRGRCVLHGAAHLRGRQGHGFLRAERGARRGPPTRFVLGRQPVSPVTAMPS